MVCIAPLIDDSDDDSDDKCLRLEFAVFVCDFFSYHFDPIVEDNFGNRLKIVIDWDTEGEGDHKYWGIKSVQNYYGEF